jgi:hypothetical protein
MQVIVEVSDEIRREAVARGLPLVDFVEMLVTKGMESLADKGARDSAIERIRALHSATAGPTH